MSTITQPTLRVLVAGGRRYSEGKAADLAWEEQKVQQSTRVRTLTRAVLIRSLAYSHCVPLLANFTQDVCIFKSDL